MKIDFAMTFSGRRNKQVVGFLSMALTCLASQPSFAGGDTNILAISDWSKAVATSEGRALRGRMLMAQEIPPGAGASLPATEFYVELENVSEPSVAPVQLCFDPMKELHCDLLDGNGNPPPKPKYGGGGGWGNGGGNGVPTSWITIPYDSSIRLRANGNFGRPKEYGLALVLPYPLPVMEIEAGDTNTYYLSGTLKVAPTTNQIAGAIPASGAQWTGTLEFPRTKIYLQTK
jgi:hypothetical protein